MSKFAVVVGVMMAFAVAGEAAPITITFDPAQPTPAGQSGSAPAAQTAASLLSYWGVTFSSSATNDPNVCNAEGPLCFSDTIATAGLGLNFLADPVLSGSMSVLDSGLASASLTLTFSAPTTVLNFGAVVGTSDPESLSVMLFGPQFTGNSPQDILLEAINGAALSEGEFFYSGSPITQAIVTFTSNSTPIFAIDNLTYNTPSPQVPEPHTSALIASGLILVLTRFRNPFRAPRKH